MDDHEKLPKSYPAESHSTRVPRRWRQRILPSMLALLLLLYVAINLNFWTPTQGQKHDSRPSPRNAQLAPAHSPPQSPIAAKGRVPLEAHIMSKCPDARDCLRELVVPAMEQTADLVDFKLSFIGEIESDHLSVKCKHGAGECLGNEIILCAQALYPNNARIYLGFANCLISSYQEIPARSLVESCALEHAVDFEMLNQCVSSDRGDGEQLLRDSVLRSQNAGVVYSCTVRLEDKVWCIRDGGAWKECSHGSTVADLVQRIKEVEATGAEETV